MKCPLLATSALALLAGLVSNAALAEEQPAWRLFVSDHAEPIVHAIDTSDGSKSASFELKAPASLYRTESGRSIFAVQGAGDVVSVISSGISFDDHGDHGDIEVQAPKLLNIEVKGNKPSHVVEHDGEIALFFDGDGKVRLLREADVVLPKAEIAEIASPAPHHGVAAVFGNHVLVTEPNLQHPDGLPVGIRVMDRAGATVGDVHACPDLHGEASSGSLMAFACSEGLLIASEDNDAPTLKLLPYDEQLPEGKSTTLLGGRGLQYFLGNYGTSGIVLIDPTSEGAFRLIALPTRRVHFAVDPLRPRFAYVFTEDGQLHRLDVIAGKLDGALRLTEPYSMDGHWSAPRPRIAVAGDQIIVSDPLKGVLHTVGATSFTSTGDIAVGGMPFNLVAVGGAGETH